MRDLSQFERWYGRDEAPPERRIVRAGPLRCELEGCDLRYVRFGELEVIRRVYAAIRDRNWGTVPPVLSNVALEIGESDFAFRFDAHNLDRSMGVDFSWHGEILGAPDGRLTLTLDGVANVDMLYNRIGWCVLHPAENAGRSYRARMADGQLEGSLPFEIGPQLIVDGLPRPLFPAFDRIDVEVADATWAQFEFEGALFEMEDQRNWTDASFKTYSAPLQEVFPHTAKAGERIRQSVRLTVEGVERRHGAVVDVPVIRIGLPGGPLPTLGVGSASSDVPLTRSEESLLAAASFDHLRVDVEPGVPRWREQLADAASVARALDAVLELALFVPEDTTLLKPLGSALREEGVGVARVLAFRRGEPTSSARSVALAREHLAEAVGDAPFVGGTNVLFTDINRVRPDIADVDGIAWPLNATVHASDDASLVETAAMHGETVRSAHAFCGNRPLHVTPITFNLRFNPHATGSVPEPGPDELPPQVDPRQPSLLGASWTVASLRHLAGEGVASVTYFETVGWRGLIEREDGPAVPERFASWPGMIFPVYHVLADVGSWHGGRVVRIETSRPLALEALAVQTDEALHVLVASLAPAPLRCRIDGVPLGGRATVRVLDEHTFATACSDPSAFRSLVAPLARDGDSLELELAPYAVARVDITVG